MQGAVTDGVVPQDLQVFDPARRAVDEAQRMPDLAVLATERAGDDEKAAGARVRGDPSQRAPGVALFQPACGDLCRGCGAGSARQDRVARALRRRAPKAVQARVRPCSLPAGQGRKGARPAQARTRTGPQARWRMTVERPVATLSRCAIDDTTSVSAPSAPTRSATSGRSVVRIPAIKQ